MQLCKLGIEDAEEKLDRIVKTLSDVARATLLTVTPNKNNETWKKDEILNSLLNERLQSEPNSESYKSMTKKIKARVKSLKNQRLSLEANAINENANRREIEELYRRMKSQDSAFKNLKQGSQCDPSKLKEYFLQHFNRTSTFEDPIEIVKAPDFIKFLQDIPCSTMETNPQDKEELRLTIDSLKKGRAANDIPTEYIQAAAENDNFLNEMVKLYEKIWQTHSIPKSWGHSKLVAIWKGSTKGKSTDPKAYRGLQIGSSMCKIMIVIILNRIKTWYDKQLLDQQQGFRSGRGTTDGIFIAKRIQQVTDKMKKPAYILFVNLSAAFDHIERKWLFQMIRQRASSEADLKLFRLLEELYSHTTTALSQNPDDEFKLTVGVRQGGPESPMLYNLYMDFVMRIFVDACKDKQINFLQLRYCMPTSASRKDRILLGYHTIDWIGYADDLLIAFEDRKSLQNALDILNQTFSRFSLTINVSKTKSMIIKYQVESQEYPTSISRLNGKDVENVRTFLYLGCNIKFDEAGVGDSEIEFRIECAERKFYELGKKFMNHKIAIRTRVKIFNSLVRSRLTYACQVWSLTRRQLQRITSAYMSMLRKMVKGGYRRKKDAWSFIRSNEDLLRICKTECIEAFISAQQRRYLAHVIREENDRISKKLLFNNNESKKRGRRVTLKTTVLENEAISENAFCKNAHERKY